MALSFTNISDRQGPAVYILGDGSSHTESRLQMLGAEIDKATAKEVPIIYLDPRRSDGLKVKEFYGIRRLPCVMIIMDDDTVPNQWNTSLPRAEEVVYTLSHISGSMRAS
jgi:hypothetical protein